MKKWTLSGKPNLILLLENFVKVTEYQEGIAFLE